MEQTMLRSEAVKAIYSGAPFSAEFIKADRKRGVGGELVEVKNWVKKREPKGPADQPLAPKVSKAKGKNPNSYDNRTVLIFNPANRLTHPIPVHMILIQTFNGKRVING